jgi:hypothetical protein
MAAMLYGLILILTLSPKGYGSSYKLHDARVLLTLAASVDAILAEWQLCQGVVIPSLVKHSSLRQVQCLNLQLPHIQLPMLRQQGPRIYANTASCCCCCSYTTCTAAVTPVAGVDDCGMDFDLLPFTLRESSPVAEEKQ